MTGGERTLAAVQNDLAALVLGSRVSVADKARRLAAEAHALGKAESAAEHRRALGVAWSAFLGMMTPEMWLDIEYLEPETWARLRAVILKGPDS